MGGKFIFMTSVYSVWMISNEVYRGGMKITVTVLLHCHRRVAGLAGLQLAAGLYSMACTISAHHFVGVVRLR